MKLCPKCKNLAFYNSHFEAFMCSECDNMWRINLEKEERLVDKHLLKKFKVQDRYPTFKLKTKEVV